MAKAAAKTGIMPMALVAVEQYSPKGQQQTDTLSRASRDNLLEHRGFVDLLF